MKRLCEKLKGHFKEVIRIKKSPHSIALGFAIGTFIGVLPIPFIDFFIGLLVISIFKKVSKLALFGGIAFWNPLTKIPVYALSYFVGDFIFGKMPVVRVEWYFFSETYTYPLRFLAGNIILAIVLSLFCYGIVYSLVWFIETDLLHWRKIPEV